MKTPDLRKTRKWIKVAKVSLLILIVLFVILSLVYGDKSLASVAGSTSDYASTAFEYFILNFYRSLSGLVGLLAVIMIIAGGIVYATSEGSPDKIKTAKEIVIAALMGALLFAFANWLLGSNGISKYFPVIPLEKLQGNSTTGEELPAPPGSSSGEDGNAGGSGSGGGGGGGGW